MERDEKGRYLKGTSGNAGGRPKGLAEQVRAATHEGADITAFYVKVATDDTVKVETRMEAWGWLADRGWGKAVQAVDHSGTLGLTMEAVVRLLNSQTPENEH